MIPVNELRDMNLVYTKDCSIVPIRIGGILAMINGMFECKPIPLSPEVLQNCGFENYFLNVGDIWIECNPLVTIIGRNNNDEGIIINVKINYLHQLQNLVFYLTGEELKYNY